MFTKRNRRKLWEPLAEASGTEFCSAPTAVCWNSKDFEQCSSLQRTARVSRGVPKAHGIFTKPRRLLAHVTGR